MKTVTLPYEEYRELLETKPDRKSYLVKLVGGIRMEETILNTPEEVNTYFIDTITELQDEVEELKSRNLWRRIFNL